MDTGCPSGPRQPPDPGPGVRSREREIREIYLKAEQEMGLGRYEASLDHLAGLAALDASHPLAYLGTALIGQRQGQAARAGLGIEGWEAEDGPGPLYGRATLRLLEGRAEEARDLYARATQGYAALGHHAGMAASATGMGNADLRLSRPADARDAYLRALGILEQLGDTRGIADTLSNLGNVEQMTGDDESAMEHYRSALELRRMLGDRRGLATTLHNLAQIQRRRGDAVGALDSLNASLAVHVEVGDRAGEARNLNAIGLIHLDRGAYAPAAAAFTAGLEKAREAGDLRAQAIAHTNLGTVHGRTGRLREALREHGEALRIRRRTGDRAGEAASLNNEAAIRELMGEIGKALRLYESSLVIARETGDRRAEAVVLVNVGRNQSAGGSPGSALGSLRRAADLYRSMNDRAGEAEAAEETGRTLIAAGDYSGAGEFLERSAAIRNDLGNRRALASSLDGLGVLAERLSDFDPARARFEEALAIQRETGERRAEAATLGHLANVHASRGELGRALRLHREALAMHRILEDPLGEAIDLNNIGAVHQAIGDRETARGYIEEALGRLHAAGSVAGEALARANLGALLEEQGDRRGARREYAESIRLRQSIEDVRGAARSRVNLGEVLAGMGRHEASRDALETGLESFRRIGDRAGAVMALGSLGDLFRRQGRIAAAEEVYRLALADATGLGMREEVGRSEAGLAACLEMEGRGEEALAGYERAIVAVESVRQDLVAPEFKTRYLARRVDLHERAVSLLWRLAPAAGGDGAAQAARALAYAERSRARSLLDLLAESRADLRRDVDPGLLRREASAIAAFARIGAGLEAGGDTGSDRAAGAFLRRAEEELELVKMEIRQSAPRYAAFVHPVPAAAPEVQRSLLRPGECLVQYLLGESDSFVWVVTPGRLAWKRLPSRARLEAEVRPFLDQLGSRAAELGDRPAYLPAARHLGRLLLPQEVSGCGTRLILVPDGLLHHLPFEALVLPYPAEDRPERLLIEDHEIVYAPSASALRLLRAPRQAAPPASRTLLAFGNPLMEGPDPGSVSLGPLPFAGGEVGAIGALFAPARRRVLTGVVATEEAIKAADLRHVGFLHFAAHAVMDEQTPGRSGIALARARGGEEDGLLQMGEIFGLRLDTDLVVLSACGTGRGRLARGEGLTGLTTALLYSGARAVVVSLWNVNDRSTSELMVAFYRELLSGATPAAALRTAKLTLLRSAGADDRHPSRWAPFVLIGDPGAGSAVAWRPAPDRPGDDEPARPASDSVMQNARRRRRADRRPRRGEERT